MAEWVGIIITALFAALGIAAVWGKFQERMNNQSERIAKLEQSSQTPEERKAMATVVHTEFESHSNEDNLRFQIVDNRITALERAIHTKLDDIQRTNQAILSAVNGHESR